MQIGTWNLEGRWSSAHGRFLETASCDVWLLTEVPVATHLQGYSVHSSAARMSDGRWWAAILSREPIIPLPDPHGATCVARIGKRTLVSSVLPWRSSTDKPPWRGSSQGERTTSAVREIARTLVGHRDVVWGGDWNHAFEGRDYVGSNDGRTALEHALESLELVAVTAKLPSQRPGHYAIDHLAIPRLADVLSVEHVAAEVKGTILSDHDAYVVRLTD